jgi:hypothetical protein
MNFCFAHRKHFRDWTGKSLRLAELELIGKLAAYCGSISELWNDLIIEHSSPRRSSHHLRTRFSPLLVISVNILLLIDFLNYIVELFMCLLPFVYLAVCMRAKWLLNWKQSGRVEASAEIFIQFEISSAREILFCYRETSDTWHAKLNRDKHNKSMSVIRKQIRRSKVHMLTHSIKIFHFYYRPMLVVVVQLINQHWRHQRVSRDMKQSSNFLLLLCLPANSRADFRRHNKTSGWVIIEKRQHEASHSSSRCWHLCACE